MPRSIADREVVNPALCCCTAGEKKLGTDEETFNVILVTQSPAQLQAIMAEYEKLSSKGLIKAIESETSGDYRQALLAIGKVTGHTAGADPERTQGHFFPSKRRQEPFFMFVLFFVRKKPSCSKVKDIGRIPKGYRRGWIQGRCDMGTDGWMYCRYRLMEIRPGRGIQGGNMVR